MCISFSCRREEVAVGDVDSKGVPVLVQDIALQRPNHPDWHSGKFEGVIKYHNAKLGLVS